MRFPNLFSPGNIGECHLKNRIIMPLFPTKYATDSRVNPKMLEFYRARAKGGVALIVLDCPCLDYPRTYKGPQELRFDTPEHAAGLIQLVDAIHAEGARAFMHLNYPRERKVDKAVDGAQKKGDAWVVSLANAMSTEEAEEILAIMANGAAKARTIGYDGVEIQASYGDLIAQLISPLLNKRRDELGGAVENRARFLTRLIERVKTSAGRDFPVMVKLVCNEFVLDGLGVDEAKIIAARVEDAGADAIIANAGNKTTKYITIPPNESPPGPHLDLAAEIKSAVNIPVVAIGKINGPELAESAISRVKANFVGMARALVADPELPQKAASGLVADIRHCNYCLQDCAEKGVPGIGRCCGVNPFAGNEYAWKILPAQDKKKVLVIGGGPSGIQAAIIASRRGHDVELWEQGQLGGQARLASIAPFKEDTADILRYLKHILDNSSVRVSTRSPAKVSDILDQASDAVIVATGSRPAILSIPGADSDMTTDVRSVYENRSVDGQKIVIIGGGDIGCETADWLAGPERQVTVVEILPDVLHRMKKIPKQRLLARLSKKDVTILTETRITAIENNRVLLQKTDGSAFELEADRVIFAIDAVPENRLVDDLKGRVKQVMAVGDAELPGNLGAALRSGTAAALNI
jgi:2,4-dienoyl-CoA reductase-like NADH-dependent reductase (Old Yellow Enzyme family)/NADPH-dependent 2,4-dienoyl-CoA reductase/sulfur reductase-like enzyme